MGGVMRRVIFASILLSAQLAFGGVFTPIKPYEGFPWPWATQCPFPWATIEGRWSYQSLQNDGRYFDFDVKTVTDTGEQYLFIHEYNGEGFLVAQGVGYSRNGQMGVLAAMHYGQDERGGYWLHVSSYIPAESSAFSCLSSDVKTAIKITPFGQKQSNEAPQIIEKLAPCGED